MRVLCFESCIAENPRRRYVCGNVMFDSLPPFSSQKGEEKEEVAAFHSLHLLVLFKI